MTRMDKEKLIQSWREGEADCPAGLVELDNAELKNVSGGLAALTTERVGSLGCCTEGFGTCAFPGTVGCCIPPVEVDPPIIVA